VLELIKEGRTVNPGEMGRIICTGLHSFAMPIIRYDIGDIGIASDEKCPCDRGLPLLKSIEGRTDDFFIAPNGNLYSPPIITHIRVIPGISQFRIIQETVKETIIQVVPNKDFTQETSRQIKETVQKLMGKDFNIEVAVVDAIPPDPSGKIRSTISKVKRQL
jgi:phenylacetate-CoA ligase